MLRNPLKRARQSSHLSPGDAGSLAPDCKGELRFGFGIKGSGRPLDPTPGRDRDCVRCGDGFVGGPVGNVGAGANLRGLG